MSTISVCMTGGSLLGKKFTFSRVDEKTTLLQFAERFLPNLGFTFVMGSLCTEFSGKSAFVFKNGKCLIDSNKNKEVVESTFGGSTNITCITEKTNHPMNLSIKDCSGQIHTLKVDVSYTFQQLGKILLEKGLMSPNCVICREYSSYHPFNEERTLAECDVDEKSVLWITPDLIDIYVRTLDGRERSLKVIKAESIKSIKSKINFGFDQRLVCEGKSLQDDEKRLQDLCIGNGRTLHQTMLCKGGGGPPLLLVDVTSDAVETLKVSKSAPEWRVFNKGLNMEGVCKNTECKANNKKVIGQHGYVTYSLGKSKSTCPLCHTDFDPIRPMYYKCVVVYNGMKANGARIMAPPKHFDALQSYKVEEAGIIEYKFLIITVNKPDDLIDDTQTNTKTVAFDICHICHKDLEKKDISFPGFCGHQFHKGCAGGWKRVNQSCPLCSSGLAL